MQRMPRTFARRTTSSVILIFLLTMALFLWLAYRSERDRHYRETFDHLVETASVLLPFVEQRDAGETDGFSELQQRLSEKTGVSHRILIVEADDSVSRAADMRMLGTDLRAIFHFTSFGAAESGAAFATAADEEWFAVSMPIGLAGERLYLMRSRRGGSRLVRQFWAIHGVHIGVTALLFFLLLRFLGERFIRRPIEQLAAHVDRVRAGEFQTRPEIYLRDEFGWLADRFTEMGLQLRETVESLVRTEKSASAAAVAYRIAREVKEPLTNLRRHLAYLEGLSGADEDLMSVASSLREDLHVLVQAVVRLEELMPESDPDQGSDQGEPSRSESTE